MFHRRIDQPQTIGDDRLIGPHEDGVDSPRPQPGNGGGTLLLVAAGQRDPPAALGDELLRYGEADTLRAPGDDGDGPFVASGQLGHDRAPLKSLHGIWKEPCAATPARSWSPCRSSPPRRRRKRSSPPRGGLSRARSSPS